MMVAEMIDVRFSFDLAHDVLVQNFDHSSVYEVI